MSTSLDLKISNLGAGFTIGFGVWTVRTAIKQTMAHRRPSRSIYLYMVWGEIIVNSSFCVLAWLFLNGFIKPGIPIYFIITFLWAIEIHLLMQIIINRVAVIITDPNTIFKIKWGIAAFITMINITVFVIWIPSQLVPPPIPLMIEINKYWDRTTKALILIVDAGLNLYFLSSVRKHLIKEHGLVKYKPLVRFNAWLMAVSVSMDVMLIILESFSNHGIIWEQFHPVAYIVKLNIEMTMAALIAKIAQGSINNLNEIWYHSDGYPPGYSYDNTPSPPRVSETSGQELIGMNPPDWPTVLNGTTYTCASGPPIHIGKYPTSLKLNTSDSVTPNLKTGQVIINDNEIGIIPEPVGGEGESPTIKETEPLRCRIGALKRTFSFDQCPSSSVWKRGANDIGRVVSESIDDSYQEDTKGIIRTREVDIRFEEIVGNDGKEKKPSQIIDDEDFIGKAV